MCLDVLDLLHINGRLVHGAPCRTRPVVPRLSVAVHRHAWRQSWSDHSVVVHVGQFLHDRQRALQHRLLDRLRGRLHGRTRPHRLPLQ